jgi:rSAM/selenodomain-associated transferase 2
MISVIIPTLNEEKNLAACLASIRAEECPVEVIVSDGGSADQSRDVADRSGAKFLTSRRGRGVQMNEGARAAGGEVFLFLHADTMLDAGWYEAVADAMTDQRTAGGAFRFGIRNGRFRYRLLEGWVKFRCALCRLPYGDQAIFVRRHIFEKMGGYRDIPLMEDVDLIERMKPLGSLRMLSPRAFTSERRWAEKGFLRVVLKNNLTMLLYRLGVRPERLHRFYYG